MKGLIFKIIEKIGNRLPDYRGQSMIVGITLGIIAYIILKIMY